MKKFLYLIQGRKENVLKYSNLQNENSDLFTLTFDVEIEKHEIESIANIFYPRSTWAEGRNKQLEAAKQLKNKYLYYIFIDDDVVFLKGSFVDFENKLLQNKPAIGIPLLTIIKNTNRYNPNLKIQHPIAVDQQIQAYHYKILEDNIAIPLETKFDYLSWWYSCEINGFLILSIYKGYLMQFNEIIVDNIGHYWSDATTTDALDSVSSYLGGIEQSGIDLIKEYITDKFGSQPKIQNSLFHDSNYSKHYYLPRKSAFFINFFKKLKKRKFKNCLQILQYQLINITNNYPKELIINDNQFKSIDEFAIKS